jgi:heme o synthase
VSAAAKPSNSIDIASELNLATVADYVALLKPRVMSLVLFTGVAGLVLAPGSIHVATAFSALLAIAVGAGASGALNMAYDADIDRLMSRTRLRPVPRGAIPAGSAAAFGTTLAVGAVTVMALFVNFVAAALLAFTIGFYVLVYTMWLKRCTPQNIVIGGLAGALPPAIGWSSVTGGLALEPLVLVAIIFLWTPPHFWALSLFRADDYARAGVPMLPVVKGKSATRIQIVVYTTLVVLSGLLPAHLGFAGPLYLVANTAIDGWFLLASVRVLRERDIVREPNARRLFGISILYLFALFAALIVEQSVDLAALAPLTRE